MGCQCSINYCGGCRNKIGCLKYIQYLEQIVNSPLSSKPPITPSIDIEPIIATLSAYITNQMQTLTTTSTAQYDNINNHLKTIDEISKQLQSALAEVSISKAVDNALVKEDSFIEKNSVNEEPLEAYSAEIVEPEVNLINDLVIYNAEAPLKKGDKYFEQKKTLFGSTKMVEKTVK